MEKKIHSSPESSSKTCHTEPLKKKHAPNFNQEALFNFFITASTLQTASVETPTCGTNSPLVLDQLPTGAGPVSLKEHAHRIIGSGRDRSFCPLLDA